MSIKQHCFFITMLMAIFALCAYSADTYSSLTAEYSKLQAAKGSRQAFINLGNRFHALYNSAPRANSADSALLYAGKSYKVAYEIYANKADAQTAISHFNTLTANFTTEAAREAYLEVAEVYNQQQDIASAQFSLQRLKDKYPDSMQALGANAMLDDLAKMNRNGQALASTYPATPVVIPPVVINTPSTQTPTGNNPVAVSTPSIQTPTDNILTQPTEEITRSQISGRASGPTIIKGIRHFTNDNYTRVVVDLTNTAKIEQHWLNADPKLKLPRRLFVDIYDSTVESNVPKQTSIKDGLLTSIRWDYNKPKVTRVVLDLAAVERFTVFQMQDTTNKEVPNKIIIDVSKKPLAAVATPGAPNPGVISLSSALGLGVNTIVIDAGHGGKDPGCTYHGYKEKDIVLDIAKELAAQIRANHKDIKVYLTRDTDKYISLEERTAFANKYKADIFISIHINASKNPSASGIETYVLNVTNDPDALEVAAAENRATTKALSDMKDILQTIMNNARLEDSLLLANYTQQELASELASKTQNRGVKQAPFYVLMNAEMASILIEAGFLSNKNEATLLGNAAYRKNIAKGIYKGLGLYINTMNKK